MLVTSDDEIYRVDQVFLGPDRFRFPWRARYRAYVVFALVFMVSQVVERAVGIPIGIWPIAFALLISVGITRKVGQYFDYDRSLKSIWQETRLEVTGPRVQTTPTRVVLTAARLRKSKAQRAAVLSEVYAGAQDAEPAESESLPSWWSQFSPRRRRRPALATSTASTDQHTAAEPAAREYI